MFTVLDGRIKKQMQKWCQKWDTILQYSKSVLNFKLAAEIHGFRM